MNNHQKDRNSVGLYVHVPFCARACEYCAFYQEKPDADGIAQYLQTMELEFKKFPPAKPIETIFMGGGTPSLLATKDLQRLCELIKKYAPDAGEWSIEMAPGTVKADKLAMLQSVGVNRFSVGVQSFQEGTLDAIGRPHTLKQVEDAVGLIKSSGIENWNLDLIFAASAATKESWLKDLRVAVELGSKHISTYCLTFESDTKLFLKMMAGQTSKPTPEQEADFYRATWDYLAQEGFEQYEISNFARPGYRCAHNMGTWNMGEWYGYGPAASSQVIDGDLYKRYTNISDLRLWQEGVESAQRKLIDKDRLTPQEIALDAIVFGMRMPEGVSLKSLQERWGRFPELMYRGLAALHSQLVGEGLLESDSDRWKLTQKGLLVADAIASKLLELS